MGGATRVEPGSTSWLHPPPPDRKARKGSQRLVDPVSDLVLLSFSATQIFRAVDVFVDFVREMFDTRSVKHIVLVSHDHLAAGLPPDADAGVRVERVGPPLCCGAEWWCANHERGTRVCTTVVGSTMARGIEEWIWPCDRVEALLRASGYVVVMSRPHRAQPDAHWLLRSLVMLHVSRRILC